MSQDRAGSLDRESRSQTRKENACGKCSETCKTGTSILCAFCDSWFHSKCIDGMTKEFVDCIDKYNRMQGIGSSFLCTICRKLVGKINHSFKDLEKRFAANEERLRIVELELKTAKTQVPQLHKCPKSHYFTLQKKNFEAMEHYTWLDAELVLV